MTDEFHGDYSLVLSLRDQVVRRLAERDVPAGLFEATEEEQARAVAQLVVATYAEQMISAGESLLPAEDQEIYVEAIIAEMYGLGRLQVLLDNPEIESIDANGADQVWVTYASGEKRAERPIADSDADMVRLIQMIAHRKGRAERQFDEAHPQLDQRLANGSRLSAVMSVSHRPVLSIRRHRLTEPTLDDLVGLGMLPAPLAHLIYAAVRAQRNIMFSGPQGAGKTTMLNAAAACIPPYERIVTVEQSFELGIHEQTATHPDAVGLEAREANIEGEGAVSMRVLVRRTKRMNANRVIVGEVLGDEVLDMLTAMLQGRSGSMCTIHSESAKGTLTQVGNYAIQSPERLSMEQALALAAQALDFVVYISLVDETDADSPLELTDGSFKARRFRRLVSEVIEVVGYEDGQVRTNTIYAPHPVTGVPGFTGSALTPQMTKRLARFGYDHSFVSTDDYEEGVA
jgi:Flp pilus assembly CpaF family ATPase